jgi:hypothetical protein
MALNVLQRRACVQRGKNACSRRMRPELSEPQPQTCCTLLPASRQAASRTQLSRARPPATLYLGRRRRACRRARIPRKAEPLQFLLSDSELFTFPCSLTSTSAFATSSATAELSGSNARELTRARAVTRRLCLAGCATARALDRPRAPAFPGGAPSLRKVLGQGSR